MSKMKSYLGDQGVGSSSDGTAPVATAYFAGVYPPSVKEAMAPRSDLETRGFAAAMGRARQTEFAQASGLPVQQCTAIEQLHADGNWRAARHPSVTPDSRVSAQEDREGGGVFKGEKAALGLAKLRSQMSGPSGSGAVR